MAWELIHIFTTAADETLYIYADWNLERIDVRDNLNQSIVGGTVTYDELQFNEGDLITDRCFGFTLKQITASFNSPYALFHVQQNSVACGYNPAQLCSLTFNTAITPSTNNQQNGRIRVDVTSGTGPYEYSLDGFNWQSGNIFFNLFSGTYGIFVRDALGCVQSQLNVIVNNTDTAAALPPTIPYQYSNKLCYFFKLVIDGNEHTIKEPIKWDGVEMVGKRDMDYHGFNFKFSDEFIDLGFDCAAGKELIEAQYALHGSDADIGFLYGYNFEGTDYLLFKGRLLLNTAKFLLDRIDCQIENEDYDAKFQSRLETKVSMIQDKTVDNDPLTPPAYYNLELHSKDLLAKVECVKGLVQFSSTSLKNNRLFILPDNTNSKYGEVKDYFEYGLNELREPPVDLEMAQFHFQHNVQANINLSFNQTITFTVKNGQVYTITITVKTYAVIYKKDVSGAYNYFYTEIAPQQTASVPALSNVLRTVNVNANWNFNGVFEKGDKIFFYVFADFENNVRVSSDITQHNFSLIGSFLESSPPSIAKGWFIDDVVKQVTAAISNNRYAIRSSLIERKNANQLKDGPASLIWESNLYNIRNFDIDKYPLVTDFKTQIEALRAMFCIGMNYSSSRNNPIIRIERADYFYQDKMILAVEEVSDYREEPAVDFMPNEIEIGYEKYKSEGLNSLDEFNTKQELITPIKKNRKKLSLIAPINASGYSIEVGRREQFAQSPSESISGDEDVHIVAVKRSGSNYVTEKNESFDVASNLISPTTVYNLRFSPKRMLYNWFIWLKGAFVYKPTTETIKVTNVLQNKTLTTKFNASETNVIGDLNKDMIIENDEIPLSALSNTKDIYKPEWIYCTARINPNDVQILNYALTGKYGPVKDYGYLLVKKPDGVWQAGWVYEIKYNFFTEQANIKMLKKYTSPSAPVADCCQELVVNNCFLLVNGQRVKL